MKSIKKLALILVLLLTLVFPTVAFAEESDVDTQTGDTEIDTEAEETKDLSDEEVGKGEKVKPWKEAKKLIEQEKDAIEILKDEVEVKMDSLELQLEAAETSGDEAAIASLKEQLEALKTEQGVYKVQMKEKITQMQKVMKDKYTVEELEQLKIVSESLNSLENVEAVPVENILVGKGNLKFDTPPVIKNGRTLIPVRAISEAMGATVEYNDEEKIVTITKGDKIIIFNLLENKAYVGENEVEIDVPAEVMNNRTMVPLRFIAENLELTVEYDTETQTIQVIEVQ